MCLILLAYRQHRDYPLILAANRDEFYARPTQALQAWSDAPHILAGRDLQAGGTWLGVSESGRLAALTNYRGAYGTPNDPVHSRGELTAGFLQSKVCAQTYLTTLQHKAARYQGFNLLLYDASGLWYFSNRSEAPAQQLRPGVYGLSNHLLDTPWPKVTRGKQALRQALIAPSLDALLSLLQDRWQPPPEQLPDTGIEPQREQLLAPMFIAGEQYGTRCSTAVLQDQNKRWSIAERSHTSDTLRQYQWPAAHHTG
jgi:uncharacterized protein with NRDE domain